MKEREITIRPVRLSDDEYGELRKAATVQRISIADYVAKLIREALKKAE